MNAAASNARSPTGRGAYVDRDEDLAAFEKLPATIRKQLNDAPFEINATPIYELWLKTQVRVGVSYALTHVASFVNRVIADELRRSRG